MAKVIFIGNYKGGVGKTTTVINLANYFAKHGKKVLTVDIDPQSSLSEIQSFQFLDRKLNTLQDAETLNYVFDLNITAMSKYPGLHLHKFDKVIHRGTAIYDFIPSSLFYRDHIGLDTLAIRMENDIRHLSVMKNLLDSFSDKYDYIIIDCPPSSNLITQSAFLLSDFYLIPTILDGLSTNGVMHYMDTIDRTYQEHCIDSEEAHLAKHFFGDKPKLIGIFYNMIRGQVNYVSDDNTFRDEMRKRTENKIKYGQKDIEEIHIFDDQVNNFIDIARATQTGRTSSARSDFEELFKQVEAQLVKLGG